MPLLDCSRSTFSAHGRSQSIFPGFCGATAVCEFGRDEEFCSSPGLQHECLVPSSCSLLRWLLHRRKWHGCSCASKLRNLENMSCSEAKEWRPWIGMALKLPRGYTWRQRHSHFHLHLASLVAIRHIHLNALISYPSCKTTMPVLNVGTQGLDRWKRQLVSVLRDGHALLTTLNEGPPTFCCLLPG